MYFTLNFFKYKNEFFFSSNCSIFFLNNDNVKTIVTVRIIQGKRNKQTSSRLT